MYVVLLRAVYGTTPVLTNAMRYGCLRECAQHGMSGLAYRPVCLVAATQAHLAGNSA